MMGKHQSAPKLYYELSLGRLVPQDYLSSSKLCRVAGILASGAGSWRLNDPCVISDRAPSAIIQSILLLWNADIKRCALFQD